MPRSWTAALVATAMAAASVPVLAGPQQPTGMTTSASNALLPTADMNLAFAQVYGRSQGMKCDGVTDDTAALRNAVSAAEALAFPGTANGGAVLHLPPGFCIVSGAIAVTGGVTIVGAGSGAQAGAGNSGGTDIRTTSATADVFTVTTDNAVAFDNFMIDTSVTKSAGAGISVTLGSGGNKWSKISRMRIVGMYDGIKLVDATGWKIRDNEVQDYIHDGILYAPDSSHADGSSAGGSSVIIGNTLWDLNVGTSNANIEIQGGGDVEVLGNKMLASAYGVLLNVTVGPTGTLLIGDNSLEENKTANIALIQATSAKDYANVTITGNEFSNLANQPATALIYVGTGTPNAPDPNWIANVTITGNVFNEAVTNGNPFISVQDGDGTLIANNALNNRGAGSGVGIATGSAANNVVENGNHAYSNGGAFRLFGSVYWPNLSTKRSPAPNILLNPTFAIDQFKEGGTTTLAGAINYCQDGWEGSKANASVTLTCARTTDAPNAGADSLLYTVTASAATAATDTAKIQQRIEAQNLAGLGLGTAAARPMSLQFWLKTSIAGTWTARLVNAVQNRAYLMPCTTQAATWTKCAFALPGDVTGTWVTSGSALGMLFELYATAGSSVNAGTAFTWGTATNDAVSTQTNLTETNGATLELSEAKLEQSDVPTEFQAPDPRSDLARAQRYYAKTFPQGTAVAQNAGLAGARCAAAASTTAGTLSLYWGFPSEMRASPTITTYNPSAANANWRDVTGAADAVVNVDPASAKGTTGVMLGEQTTALTAAHNLCIHATADARL